MSFYCNKLFFYSGMSELMEKKRCIICRKTLNNGIIINGRIICKACEKRLVNSRINTDFYNYYRDCIKKTLIDLLLKERTTRFQTYI